MLLAQLFVKMAHVKIVKLLPVQPQDLLRRLQRYPPWTGPATTAIPQSVIPPFLIAPVPTPHLPLTDADDLRGLPPADPLGHRSQDHFLYFHRPLPGDASCGSHAFLRLVFLPQVAPQKRTFHVLISPDTSRATDASPWIVYKTCHAVGDFTDLTGANCELPPAPSRVTPAICCSNCNHRCGFGTADVNPYQQSERGWLLCPYPN